ncbi:MAG: hypothetical protein KGV44_12570 [Flavobacteriaceae bacterium]|nr:hypothetical protein [Flavobacteriaceae bacterium]
MKTKTKKAILGLSLCLGMILSMGTLQRNTQANIGWGISAAFGADRNTTSINATVGAVGLAVYGAKVGAEIGTLGGPVGFVVGGCVGAL